MSQPDSLVARILKSKYYPNSSPLVAGLGTRPSFAWKSIRQSQSLMRIGTKREVGRGSDFNILSDPWLATIPPRPPEPRSGIDPSYLEMVDVQELGSDEWKWSALLDWFPESEVDLIMQIRPGLTSAKDGVSWMFNNDGNMVKKKMAKDQLCPRCGDAVETVNHVLFECPYARLVYMGYIALSLSLLS